MTLFYEIVPKMILFYEIVPKMILFHEIVPRKRKKHEKVPKNIYNEYNNYVIIRCFKYVFVLLETFS